MDEIPQSYFSAAEIGKMFGVSAKTILRAAKEGLPHYMLRKKAFFKIADIETAMREQRFSADDILR